MLWDSKEVGTGAFRKSRTQAATNRRHTGAALALLALVLALILPSHQSVSAAYVVGTDGWGLLDPLPATSDLYDVWVSSSSDVFAVGKGGTVVRYDGAGWTTDNCGISKNLNGVWGSSSDNVFAVAATGEIVHYDGTAWSQMTSPAETSHLADVWGSSSSNVFAVGNGGTVIHYDGNSDNVWSEMNVGTLSENLYDVWGTSSVDVYAVGDKGTLLHYDGNAWS